MSDAAELEREAEAARARLSDTADQIRARMSPGQMMDEILDHLRGGDGSQMLANLRGQARDNPMALALVGSGLAWLMMGSSGQTQAKSTAGPYPGTYPAAETETFGTRQNDASRVGTEAESAAGRGSVAEMAKGVSSALSSARSAVGAAEDGLEHEARDRTHRLAHDLRSAGSDALGEVRHSATGVGQQARDTFFDVLEREPLVIGAIGVAVGAAIGAFLPATKVERQHLGPAGEALKEKAETLADRGMVKAKEAAAKVYETAHDEADRQGLLPGDAPIAGKLDAVVRAVGETAGEIAGRSAPEAASSETKSDAGSAADSEVGSDAGSPSGQPQMLRP